MTEEEMWEQMVQELRERRANRKKGVRMTAVAPTGSHHVVSMDFASLYPNTMHMKISMKSILRKRSINKIYAQPTIFTGRNIGIIRSRDDNRYEEDQAQKKERKEKGFHQKDIGCTVHKHAFENVSNLDEECYKEMEMSHQNGSYQKYI